MTNNKKDCGEHERRQIFLKNNEKVQVKYINDNFNVTNSITKG